jgi:putative toxin-antitoxin system antitoxin component (TIGR02293 family)
MSKTAVGKPRRDSKRLTKPAQDQGSGHTYVGLLGMRANDTPGLLEEVREGLPYNSWERFLASTGLSKEAASGVVQITSRTLARRKEQGRLHPDESDRLVPAARIFCLTVGLFEGDHDAARRWLTNPQPALGGSSPWDYAAAELGAREVESLIGRLERGIPS